MRSRGSFGVSAILLLKTVVHTLLFGRLVLAPHPASLDIVNYLWTPDGNLKFPLIPRFGCKRRYELQVAAWTEEEVSLLSKGALDAHLIPSRLTFVGLSRQSQVHDGSRELTFENPFVVFRREGNVVFHFQEAFLDRKLVVPKSSLTIRIHQKDKEPTFIRMSEFEGLEIITSQRDRDGSYNVWTAADVEVQSSQGPLTFLAGEPLPFVVDERHFEPASHQLPRKPYLLSWVGREVWLRNLPHEYISFPGDEEFDVYQLNHIRVGVTRELFEGAFFVQALHNITLVNRAGRKKRIISGRTIPLLFHGDAEFYVAPDMHMLYQNLLLKSPSLEGGNLAFRTPGSAQRPSVALVQIKAYHRELLPGFVEAFHGYFQTFCLLDHIDMRSAFDEIHTSVENIVHYGTRAETIRCMRDAGLRADLVVFTYAAEYIEFFSEALEAPRDAVVSLRERSLVIQHCYIDFMAPIYMPSRVGVIDAAVSPIIGDLFLLPAYHSTKSFIRSFPLRRKIIAVIGSGNYKLHSALKLAEAVTPSWRVRWMTRKISALEKAATTDADIEVLIDLPNSIFLQRLLESDLLFLGAPPAIQKGARALMDVYDEQSVYFSRSSFARRLSSVIVLSCVYNIPLILPASTADIYMIPQTASVQFKESVAQVVSGILALDRRKYNRMCGSLWNWTTRLISHNRNVVASVHEVVQRRIRIGHDGRRHSYSSSTASLQKSYGRPFEEELKEWFRPRVRPH